MAIEAIMIDENLDENRVGRATPCDGIRAVRTVVSSRDGVVPRA